MEILKSAIKRQLAVLYVRVVDNNPEWKFDDIAGCCKAGSRVRHLTMNEESG